MESKKFWLLKAEPDSRIVKGKDVKFSIDDFEQVKTSPWEGVRNYEARNLMKEMNVGDKALFYHSNCKNPGIAGFAEVSKEAYPDYTAWDESHPYFDPKTDKANPKWFMVDLTFVSRARCFIPLSLLRYLSLCTVKPPQEVSYIGESGLEAIRAMDLVTRGRLSVQRVDEKAWEVISSLAQNGGWEDMNINIKKTARKPPRSGPGALDGQEAEATYSKTKETRRRKASNEGNGKPELDEQTPKAKSRPRTKRRTVKEVDEGGKSGLTDLSSDDEAGQGSEAGPKRKAQEEADGLQPGRKSRRTKS